MNTLETLIALVVLIGYHGYVINEVQHTPQNILQASAARMRQAWIESIMDERRDILAVQTLRNLATTSSFLASTAMLIAIGLLTLFANVEKLPSVMHTLNLIGTTEPHTTAIKLLALVANFFIAFFNHSLALRYYNYIALAINIPNADLQTRKQVITLMHRSAMHHTLGMRGFLLAIPLGLWLFGPLWMLLGAIILIGVLYSMDHVG